MTKKKKLIFLDKKYSFRNIFHMRLTLGRKKSSFVNKRVMISIMPTGFLDICDVKIWNFFSCFVPSCWLPWYSWLQFLTTIMENIGAYSVLACLLASDLVSTLNMLPHLIQSQSIIIHQFIVKRSSHLIQNMLNTIKRLMCERVGIKLAFST